MTNLNDQIMSTCNSHKTKSRSLQALSLDERSTRLHTLLYQSLRETQPPKLLRPKWNSQNKKLSQRLLSDSSIRWRLTQSPKSRWLRNVDTKTRISINKWILLKSNAWRNQNNIKLSSRCKLWSSRKTVKMTLSNVKKFQTSLET